jgi:hemolysin III
MSTQPKTRGRQESYTPCEERLHSVTHGIGTGLSVIGLIALIVLTIPHGNVYQLVGFSIYGTTLVTLYLASTLYHGLQHPGAKRILRIIDHASIFLFIAGTYTPFVLVNIRNTFGWTILITIWILAISGISLKTFFIQRFNKLAIVAYILMGWLGVIGFNQLLANVPIGSIIWLVAGGIAYTVGIVFYMLKKVRYTHAAWHLFVLTGSICHYCAVLFYLTPTY